MTRRLTGLVFLMGVALMTAASVQAADKPAPKVLRHIVMYKFKDGLAPARVQEVVDAFAGLPKKIDAIIDFEHGTNVSEEGKSEGFTHIFVVTFRDEAGRAAYLKHPAHDAYVAVVKDKREKVIVFDYWAPAK
ncbi:MAG TPA: Dabb family protein [Planctomycetaceae bacterium]|nr:Dabb family protein [Planctomycetaceae bacterium]